jgi:RNA polymerase sigma-70 factor (ECF subfamily)
VRAGPTAAAVPLATGVGAVEVSQRELEGALSTLPEVFRTVFVLRVLEGTSSVETAASLGVHETTVRTRLYRAQRRLGPELTSRLRAAPELLAPGSELLDRLVARVLMQPPHGSILTISASPP